MDVELEYSRQRGSLGLWGVAQGYKVRDGVVRVELSKELRDWLSKIPNVPGPVRQPIPEEGLSYYPPFAHRELPLEFARLKTGDEAAVLDFVRRRGLLGRNALAVLDFPDPREALRHSRETLDWLRNHARTVEMLLVLLDSRHESRKCGDSQILWDVLRRIWLEGAAAYSLAGVEYAVGSFDDLKTHLIMGDPEKPEEMAGQLLKAVIEPNIRYLSESLLVEDDGAVRRQSLSRRCSQLSTLI
jgi:hypothetical protein